MNQARRTTAAILAAIAAAAAGCDQRGGADATGMSPQEAEAVEAGYVRPPQVTGVTVVADGLVVRGSGPRGERVRLVEAGGRAYGGEVGRDGGWSLALPRASAPALFTVTVQRDLRPLPAEGRLLVLPDGRAVVLRAGHGALPIAAGPGVPPRIVSLDVASDGAAAVSGFAQPSARVVTVVDGAPATNATVVGQGGADVDGRFAVILARPLTPGAHTVTVNTPDGVAGAEVAVSATEDLGAAPLRAVQEPQGWRVSWRLPGGGVQTTYILGGGAATPAPASVEAPA